MALLNLMRFKQKQEIQQPHYNQHLLIRTKEYKYLKSNWKLFLANRWNLKDSVYVNKKTGVVYYTLDKIDMVLKAYPELAEIYWSKDYFSSSVLKLKEYEETKELIDFFIQKFENSTIKEIRK